MKKNKLENIESFTNSDLNSSAEQQFTEKELQGYFDEKRKIKYGEKLDKEFDIRKLGTHIDDDKKKSNSMMRYLFLALTGILLLIAAYYFFSSSANKDQPAQPEQEMQIAYLDELYTPIDFNVRGALSDQQQLLNTLGDAYDKKDFATVIAEYQKLKKSDAPYDMNVEQMAGVAYGSLENYDQAIITFNGILGTPESSYSNHTTVRYLLGLVYLLKDDKANARQILQQIKSGDYKYEAAQELLKGL